MIDYKFKIDNFEGPLDLLLHLISKAKIEPKDIFMSQITEQYLEYIEAFKDFDMDKGSEFIQMAATLIYIKSRSLLPKKRLEEELNEDGLTPEEQLIKSLNEYKKYKEASVHLREMEQTAKAYFYKLPEEVIEAPKETEFNNADVQLLVSAYINLVKKLNKKEQKIEPIEISTDRFSVKNQIKVIMARLTIVPKITFFDLLSEHISKEEVAVTFMALLELIHTSRISIKQNKMFDNIFIERKAT